jgi:hypothetical protein
LERHERQAVRTLVQAERQRVLRVVGGDGVAERGVVEAVRRDVLIGADRRRASTPAR